MLYDSRCFFNERDVFEIWLNTRVKRLKLDTLVNAMASLHLATLGHLTAASVVASVLQALFLLVFCRKTLFPQQ